MSFLRYVIAVVAQPSWCSRPGCLFVCQRHCTGWRLRWLLHRSRDSFTSSQGRRDACTTEGTAVRPILGQSAKAGGNRIILHVLNKGLEVLQTADEVVERFSLPTAASDAQYLVHLVGSVRFPGMQDIGRIMRSQGRENGVNVIGHDTPSGQGIALAVEEPHGFLHQVRQLGTGQDTRAERQRRLRQRGDLGNGHFLGRLLAWCSRPACLARRS